MNKGTDNSRHSINRTPTVPIEPLLPFLKVRFKAERPEADFDDRKLREANMAQYVYGRRGHVTVYKADDIAYRLGLFPFEIWENWYDLPVKEDLQMHGLTRQQLADALPGITIGTIHSWKRSGVWSNVNDWVDECLSRTCAPA